METRNFPKDFENDQRLDFQIFARIEEPSRTDHKRITFSE